MPGHGLVGLLHELLHLLNDHVELEDLSIIMIHLLLENLDFTAKGTIEVSDQALDTV